MVGTESSIPNVSFNRPTSDTLVIQFTGRWKIGEELPSHNDAVKQLESGPRVGRLSFETSGLTGWDTGLLTFLTKVIDQCNRVKIGVEKDGLPYGVQRLLELASAVPEKKEARKKVERESFLAHVGSDVISFVRSAGEMLNFIGEAFFAFLKLLVGKARYRRADLVLTIQECGAQALPIVSLISLLVGLILAFVGAVQLRLFGAEIYVANLVGIATVRVMGAVMTGIIMAGRTGGAFAAQLGTMETNEEIDALRTLGISPMEYLVLPRMLALMLMMPLLCLYANVMGILGGLVIGVGMLDLGLIQYYDQTVNAVSLNDLFIGLFQGAVFGALVALAGCLRGMQCGRSASAVGDASTSAVVTGIVSIIVATAIITIICNVLGV
jgi:phospholipid/cholesterol/gamma-HCH transport system permease protein